MMRRPDRVASLHQPSVQPIDSGFLSRSGYGQQHRRVSFLFPRNDSFQPPRVLVVDSDAENRERYRDSLRIAGWEVTQAEDGRDALVKLVTIPSLLLTELRLPIIDGMTAL